MRRSHSPGDDVETVAGEPVADNEDQRRSRRQLLTLAGGAVAGGTALALAGASPAGATDGNTWIVGSDFSSQSTTSLNGPGDFGAAALSIQSYDVDLVAIEGVATNGPNTLGVDVKCGGTGRLSQYNALTGDAQPTFGIFAHEIVRSDTGNVWASTGNSGWKRINAVRLDNPNGDGTAFAPFRLLDTRSGAPVSSNTTINLDVSGSANLPDDIIGVFGNITVVSPTFGGFVKLFPRTTGSPPNTSAVNFTPNAIVANSFFVGVGRDGSWTGGHVSYRGGDAGGTYHLLIDITAYVQ